MKGVKRDLHRVLLLSERGFVSVQRRGDDGLLAAHGSGRERRVLQIKRVLFGPQVEKLGGGGIIYTQNENLFTFTAFKSDVQALLRFLSYTVFDKGLKPVAGYAMLG